MTMPFNPPARCPDISSCCATQLHGSELVLCLNDNRLICDYPLPYGDKFFCLHPQCLEIAGRSKR